MTTADTTPAPENHTFEADAREKLREEAIANPALLGYPENGLRR